MNDFVDRLLGRPGAAPIRPVVPMLFEPAAPLRTPPALPMGTFSESGPPGEPVAPPDGPSPVPIVVPAAEPATFVRESRETHETRVEPAAPQRPPGRLVRETVREVPQERDDPVALPVTIGTAAPVVAVPVAMAPAAVAPRAAELPAAAPMAVTPAAVASTTASEPVRAHPVTRARPGPAPAGPPRPPMARRAAEPAGPDVHISIGRVEIKAVPGPAPAPRPERHRRPVLGLDEYLKERAGGDRG
ncbi:hypothetical protein OG943_08190 [Amycolatopsis sp. NBC_00345]|uniref:hypothetical protein n=1 Tax=Amycolatopsis sp. NBC_00345 TaxID=2975955 RepID=UPI002E25F417